MYKIMKIMAVVSVALIRQVIKGHSTVNTKPITVLYTYLDM